ncbi:MAG TPA: biopolymer transporter ExbD [Candidatus Eisenbacteria bacterium]|nr:biopolymer transporter ExbD [Candidatus Eisenbacteria bacterium]
MGANPVKSSDGIYDVNMTPLIDVSLVLVVILLVATPLAFQSSIALKSASTSGRSAAQVTRSERVELTLLADGRVQIDRDVVSRELLGQRLEVALLGSATRTVVVRCESGVTHGAFVTAVDEARARGAQQIAVVGR